MPMRIRNTDALLTRMTAPRIQCQFVPQGHSSSLGYWPEHDTGSTPVFIFKPIISNITDFVGDRGRFNPVRHRSLTSSMMRLSDWLSLPADGGSRHFVFDGVPFPLVTGERFDNWPWFPDSLTSSLSDWSIEAYNAFTEQVPTTVSLANFMYELKDMKGMIPSIDRSSISKTAGNNFLAFEFGVLPFISDIKAILAMSDSVQKRISFLLSRQGKASKLSFSRTTAYDAPFMFTKSLMVPNSATAGIYVEFKRMNAKDQFHIGASLYQDLTGLSDALGTLKALAASGGFNHPARVIWNAIPYSFVVDWFFHVGKLLDSLTVQPFGGQYSVSNIGYSVKRESVFYATQVTPSASTGLAEQRSPIGVVKASDYTRDIGYPATSVFITSGVLTPMQQALSVAMLNQRRH